MTDTLFNIPETPSPRLKWMSALCIKTSDNGDHLKPGDEDEFGNPLSRWVAWQGGKRTKSSAFWDHRTGWGDTEDDAIVALAKKLNLKLWNE